MKKIFLLSIIAITQLLASDPQQADPTSNEPDFIGFMGIKSCVEEGLFKDCDLKNYNKDSTFVAIINNEIYDIDRGQVKMSTIDNAILRNDVKFFGKIDGGVLKLKDVQYQGSPKTFFKGCI